MLFIPATIVFADVSGVFEFVDYDIKLGNVVEDLQYHAYLKDNRVYVSVREICEKLGIPVYWNEENEEVKIDIYNKNVPISDKTLRREEGVIPDSETAFTVGKLLLEKYAGKPLEYETEDKVYYLEVYFREDLNAWRIYQTWKYKDEKKMWAMGGVGGYIPCITLSRETGEVLYINTHCSFWD